MQCFGENMANVNLRGFSEELKKGLKTRGPSEKSKC